ncbi:alpha/beta fold hydrolase [Mameliella alba]|uniref:alpha/beta fold hydrolase BchO n=1 Tax=Mameliella alba TaxID=561184 RepID=UPI001C93869B|nr:alpha/beta fold hydrolase BchO [Mameliella alba]MBY6122271.1 alpha/beta fold hydrolase [Mameliella alba]
MDWDSDLPDWPHSGLSRRIAQRPHLWHVQETGTGDTVLLLHGAGASTHSWRDVIPILARQFRVVALDLPGQGFTRLGSRARCSLAHMTEDIAALCAAQGWHPAVVIGHSAGGAIALNLARRLRPAPAVVCLNAALGRFDGAAGWLFPILAKLMAATPLAALAFTAAGASPARTRRLIASTGSRLSDEGIGYYTRLTADRAHVDGTLQMMARWNVDPVLDWLPRIETPCLMLAAEGDRAVAPEISRRATVRLPLGQFQAIPGLGHLAHEEDPDAVMRPVLDWMSDLPPACKSASPTR